MGEHIGFIGLGRMGSAMAGRLIDAGHSLTVFDVSEPALTAFTGRGAAPAGSPREVADAAEVVIASLPSPAIVQETALGPTGVIHGSKVKTFIDVSTTGPKVAGVLAKGLQEKGIVSLDAPVSGGVKGAREGTVAVMVGGPKASFDALSPILQIIGRLYYMGPEPGSGQTMKLVNNLLSLTAIAITAEGMAMGQKAGLDPKLMIEVLNVSTGKNSATEHKWPRSVLPRTFDFGFATGLSLKDVRLCLEEAEAMGVPMVVGSGVRQLLSITHQLYGPDSDFTEMAKVVETWAGLDPKPAG
jgi:3-hydroxyisobutyrate dehydrogenase-like beta-hydroxyacid dehydrogenase